MNALLTRREFVGGTLKATGGAALMITVAACSPEATTMTTPAPTSAFMAFPQDFLWGVATSAYQIEGAAHEDGRGQSIWDTFSHTPGKTVGGATGDVADDHYHRFAQDLDLMQQLGIQSYRFSIAWPRIVPAGSGAVNQKGLDFYRRLVEGLLQRNIRPMATLFHWDLPQALQERGGWEQRDTAQHFADYAAVVFRALGDVVPVWLTLNEPKTVVDVGYIYGSQAPGLREPARAYRALHHMMLGHGLAVQALRGLRLPQTQVGVALNLSPVYAADQLPGTAAAVRLQDGLENRLYLDPICLGRYPEDVVQALQSQDVWPDASIIQANDLKVISTPIDILGVNYYNPITVTAGPQTVPGPYPTSVATWESIYPDGLYDILLRVKQDYGDIPLYITENGAPFEDTLAANGTVDDPQRWRYIAAHLTRAHRALAAGVHLRGYYAWSLLDNFEWAEGFSQRWGLVYVDYATQRRYPKNSAFNYRDVIKQQGLPSLT